MISFLRKVWAVLEDSVRDFFVDRVPQFAAALSFYAAFSMAPLLVMMLTVLALLLDGAAAREYVLDQIGGYAGDQVSTAVDGMLTRASQTQRRGTAALVAFFVMLIGATAVIMSLKGALDHIFGTHNYATARALALSLVKARFKAFAMVLILSALLAASLVFTAMAGGIATAIGDAMPDWVDIAGWLNVSVAMAIVILLIFIVYRFFPDLPPGNRAALTGAVIAAILVALGKGAITWYVNKVGAASAFGAAGALAVILIWIFITANFVLLGAEIAKAADRQFHSD